MKVIHLVKRLMEKHQKRKWDSHMIFIDLEKVYGKVLREVLQRCLKASGVLMASIREIKGMYNRDKTQVRMVGGDSDFFSNRVVPGTGTLSISCYLGDGCINVVHPR